MKKYLIAFLIAGALLGMTLLAFYIRSATSQTVSSQNINSSFHQKTIPSRTVTGFLELHDRILTRFDSIGKSKDIGPASYLSDIVNNRVAYAFDDAMNNKFSIWIYDLQRSEARLLKEMNTVAENGKATYFESLYYDGKNALIGMYTQTDRMREELGSAQILQINIDSGKETILLSQDFPIRPLIFDYQNNQLLFARSTIGSALYSKNLTTGEETEIMRYEGMLIAQNPFLLSPSKRFIFRASHAGFPLEFENMQIYDRATRSFLTLPHSLAQYFQKGEWRQEGTSVDSIVWSDAADLLLFTQRRGVVDGDGYVSYADTISSTAYAWDVNTNEVKTVRETHTTPETIIAAFQPMEIITRSLPEGGTLNTVRNSQTGSEFTFGGYDIRKIVWILSE